MTRAVIVGMGAMSPLGLTITQAAFLLRTGMPGFTPSALADANGEPVTFGLQPTIDPKLVALERAALLAAPAIREAFIPIREFVDQMHVGALIALDEGLNVKDTWGATNPAADLIRDLQNSVREIAPNAKITPVARGAAGPAFALPDALSALDSGGLDALLFGGVHSDYDPTTIRLLEDQHRLFTPDNLDAVIPGECASFVLLMRPDAARRVGIEAYARIIDVAGGFEKANPDNDESSFEAKGLTTTIRAASKKLVENGQRAGWMLTDLTFEMWRLQEWQAMITRTREVWADPYAVESPAQRMGRLGAAALPFLSAVAAEAWKRGFGPAPTAIAFAGSDSGERGALVLARAE
jgi:3-oxoacyl-[acyl-carrier-protein] synthase I